MNLLIQIFVLLGTVGLFLYGMKVMSEALQKVAGARLRSVLSTVAASPWRGILAGTFITGLVQSSSAVTVMIVGFVNAGLLSLVQSIAMIMGANIGTTVTAWLVSVLGYRVDIGLMAVPLVGLAFPLLFFRRSKIRSIGNAVIGFALMMLAINILNGVMGALTDDPATIRLVEVSRDFGAFSPVFFVLIGAVLTALLQSSSAVMALTIVLSGNGLIPLECAMALVLGENIGTTATANIAALVTNTDARRAAFVHFLFNLFGAVWGLLLLPVLLRGVVGIVLLFGGQSPLVSADSQPIALALFHTLFNVTNTLLLVWFIPRIARIAERVIRSGDGRHGGLRHIDAPLMSTGELSVYQVQKELYRYARGASESFKTVRDYFRETNKEQASELCRELVRQRDESQRRKAEMDSFLFRIAEEEISQDGKQIVQRLFRQIADVAAVYEGSYAVEGVLRRKRDKNIWFPPQMREQVNGMFVLAGQLLDGMAAGLGEATRTEKNAQEMLRVKEELSDMLARLEEDYLKGQNSEDVKHPAGVIFSELIGCFGRLSAAAGEISGGGSI